MPFDSVLVPDNDVARACQSTTRNGNTSPRLCAAFTNDVAPMPFVFGRPPFHIVTRIVST